MSLLSNQSSANSTTGLWSSTSSGGSAGSTGATGPTGQTGPAGPAGSSSSSRLVLQVADGTNYMGGDAISSFNGITLVSSGSDMTQQGGAKVIFNTTGLYKICLNSGFSNGPDDPVTVLWGTVYSEKDIMQWDTTATNDSSTQNFLKVLASGWYVLLYFKSSAPITYTSNLSPCLNVEITKVV